MQDLTTFIANHMGLTYAFAIVVILLFIVEILRSRRNAFNIDVPQAVHLMNRENAVVIDIRPAEQFQKGHILDAMPLPASDMAKSAQKLEKFRKKPLIIVCQSGIQSQKIAALLIKQGYNTYSLAGGLRAWSEANMPITK